MNERRKNLLLTPEWPTHFPERCQKCDNRYDPILSLELGPGRLGRFLKFIALWLPLAALPIWLPARIQPLHFLMAVFLPSFMILIFGHLLPKKTRLHCHNCGKTEYFNPPESWEYRLAAETEDQKNPGLGPKHPSLKQPRRFTLCREMPAALLFPNHFAIATDLKNSAATTDECHLLTRRLFNLSRHTVGFRAVVSLLAVFNLDIHG